MRIFALDGTFAKALNGAFQVFVVSVGVILAALPYFAFEALVGWQPTHVAVWLGSLSLLPLGPGVAAALASQTAWLRGVKPTLDLPLRFFRTFVDVARRGALWWLLQSFFIAMLSYNGFLFAASDLAFVAVVAGFAVLVAWSLQVGLELARDTDASGLALIASAGRSLARAPHLALAGLIVVFLGAMVVSIPAIGPSLGLLVPGAVAWGVAAVHHPRAPRLVTEAA